MALMAMELWRCLSWRTRQISRRTGLDPEQIQHLVETYGRRYTDLLEIAGQGPELRERLCKQNPDIRAQLAWNTKRR
jgi:glycerol-3-phosphate dehydrogenase